MLPMRTTPPSTAKLTIPSPSMVHCGGFEPLRFVPPGKMVAPGLVTTQAGRTGGPRHA